MDIILDELRRTLKYHKRQHDDNLNQIRSKKEAINMLEESNKKHLEAMKELESFIEKHEVKE